MLGERIERAQDFIWRHARLIERFRFAYHFKGASAEPVLAALRAYQNADGGFGNALEPDKRDPHSQPVDVQVAFEIMDEIHCFDETTARRVCDFLAGITTPEGGVPYALFSANSYPHAPWWTVKDERPPASLNPTAAIVGLLLKHRAQHAWVSRATDYCWRALEASETGEFHDLMPMIGFLEHASDKPRAAHELDRIAQRIKSPGIVETDPQATGYLHKPLDWAPEPASFCAKLFNDDLIALHLEALAGRQQDDGGWPISWQPISKAVEIEWRGIVTINALRTLRAYGWDA